MSTTSSEYGKLNAEEHLEVSIRAQRLALGFLAESVASLFDPKARAAFQERLNHWAEEADMHGGEPLYGETADLLRVMAERVGECAKSDAPRAQASQH
ncbi:hypothetical protein [Achromobacter piechaudii]|uniref:Uncharacterized protein n=1 Tax=Achromobacter piechaudii TaxID=72556 RepID=A0ABM8L2W6_9BURK|nr:hypothetical protein [Achromobacter piechaudii]CAB3728702.1 hypothetical protein LMG1873_04606 [Achromobacter piechaudii]CAB3904833.1 hypothetical protein LMG2828_04693 [Achromobacter piechaudii]CAB3952643.1 hypothetical protein LMG6103_03510 [Achromobacter piechaudii]